MHVYSCKCMIHICNLIIPSLKNEKDVVSPCDGGDDRFTASIHITACCIRKGGNVDTYIDAFIDWVLWQHACCQTHEQKCSLEMLRPKATVWFGEKNLTFDFTDPPTICFHDW